MTNLFMDLIANIAIKRLENVTKCVKIRFSNPLIVNNETIYLCIIKRVKKDTILLREDDF